MNLRIQKRLGRFLRRWPRIGIPARHPLTEFLIDWRPRSQARRFAEFVVRVVLPIAGYLLLVFLIVEYFGPQTLLRIRPIPFAALAVLAAALVWIVPRSFRFSGNRFHPNTSQLFRLMDKNTALQLWMAPLNFRELLAIEAARTYASHRGKSRAAFAVICAYLLVFGFAIFHFFALRYNLPEIDYGIFFAAAFMAVAPLIAIADDLFVMSSINRYSNSFARTIRDVLGYSGRSELDTQVPEMFLVFPVAASVLVFILYRTNAPTWLWFSLILSLGALLTVAAPRLASRWTQWRFERCVAKGERSFKSFLRRVAGE